MAKELLAPVVWAQRKDQIFVGIDVQDVKNEKITLESNKLTFSGTSKDKHYTASLELFGEIDPKESKYVVRPRGVDFVLQKKEIGPYWDQFLKEKGKREWLKVDWNKWVDEDEVSEETGGFDMGGMGNFDMSNMGGLDKDMDHDSDDEDIPDLEENEAKDKEDKEKKEEEEITTASVD